ncbi:MAG TPA: GAF domain-containing protein, partial [Sphingomonadaceae bacterium]|nr:GAF domain-containing protein [Sphingomonadaceae bacterium]
APETPESWKTFSLAGNFRSVTQVPLIREGRGIGVLGLFLVRPGFRLNDKQRALAQTFADQAVIAIENVRLLNETKEALERQTATAEILKVISESPTDTQPVFEAIAESAARLFSSWNVAVVIREGQLIHLRAARGPALGDYAKVEAMFPIPFNPDSILSARAIASARFLEFPDTEGPDIPSIAREMARAGGHRALAYMPLLREGRGIGAIVMISPNPGSRFSEHQVSLLRTFADQAVIAIENVRLFNETKEALERQTATAEILRVISRSPTNIQPVLDAVADSAARLCEAADCAIFRSDGDRLMLAAYHGPVAPGPIGSFSIPLSRESIGGRTVLQARTLHVADIRAAADEYPTTFQIARQAGLRTML